MRKEASKNEREETNLVLNFLRMFGLKRDEPITSDSEVDKLREELTSLDLLPPKSKKPKVETSKYFKESIKSISKLDFNALITQISEFLCSTFPDYFNPLKRAVVTANLSEIPNLYVGKMVLTSFLMAFSVFFIILFRVLTVEISIAWAFLGLITVPFLIFMLTFVFIYAYPFQRTSSRGASVDANLPFAITHMAAIASSGAPPEQAFRMLAKFEEYGEVTTEAKIVMRQIDLFGNDITSALRYTVNRTPSEQLKELLFGILAIIESGGDLREYLNEMAEIALFDYKLARKRYVEALSTYADMYTAILIAAPLFLVAILAVMNIIPGSVLPGGMSINMALALGVYALIPALNILFLAFITYTQPQM